MKKFTLLLIVSLVCTIAFGQAIPRKAELSRDIPAVKKHSQNLSFDDLTKDAFWTNDFSNASDWVMDHAADAEDKDWVICTMETAPDGWIPPYGMPEDFASETVDNGFALFNSDAGSSSGAPTQDSWIQIANPIDLTDVDVPRFIFTTYYKRWADVTTFEYSVDDGATWSSVELFPDVVQGGATTPNETYLLNVPELGNEASVLFRFRQVGDWDYGWYIDDINIVDAPDYDLKLTSAATNFFSAVDYTQPGNGDYYHISSHYGKIPDEIATTESSFIFFNVVVDNNGMQDATPVVDITITDSETNEVYTYNYVHSVVLAAGEKDTLDIAWEEADAFLLGPDEFVLGNYDIDFELSIDGQTDAVTTNNSFSTYFEITDYEYARDGGNLDGVCGPGIWLDGGNDGDMFAVDYTFFESSTLDSVQAYVTSTSAAGTSLICHVFSFDVGSETWVEIAASPLSIVEEADLGTWKTFTFADPVNYDVPAGESLDLKIAFSFYYNGGEDLWIGEDNTIPSSVWGTNWKFVADDGWTTITNYYDAVPMIRAFILPTLLNTPQNFVDSDINMYPNPSTGIVTISNVEEGSTIEIINLMGQVVKVVESANTISNIDLSNEANGTYIVRVIDGINISTSKLNLQK